MMRWRTPSFWWNEKPSLWARVLQPLGFFYGFITLSRMNKAGQSVGVPVICIGNFTMGGSGKTPAALSVFNIFQGHFKNIAFLSRGYGGKLSGPLVVEPSHVACEVGDEPVLLAQYAPVIVSHDRVEGAKLAVKNGADLIIMDDGLQNPSLRKTFSLAVVDGQVGVGNGLCFPAGPLRAPLKQQWPFIDAVLVAGKGNGATSIVQKAHMLQKQIFYADLVPFGAESLQKQKVLAFAGIGRPKKFFQTLHDLGTDIAENVSFPDHHPYVQQDVDVLAQKAKTQQLQLVTTEKDAVKLRAFKHFYPRLFVLKIKMIFSETSFLALQELAQKIMKRHN